MQTLSRFSTSQFPLAILLSVFMIAMGATVVAKFDSKWGYVIIGLAVLFGLFTLRARGIL